MEGCNEERWRGAMRRVERCKEGAGGVQEGRHKGEGCKLGGGSAGKKSKDQCTRGRRVNGEKDMQGGNTATDSGIRIPSRWVV